MLQDYKRYFNLLIMPVILASVVFVYSPAIFDRYYQGEDYLFVSQVSRLGFTNSILLSWKDHFLPLYRLTMGGLHLLFKNAIPIRLAILAFHLANTALIFHIVRRCTRSAILSTIAAATLGLSRQAPSELLFSINGHWVMSLCFVLIMSIYFDKFLKSRFPPAFQSRPEIGGANGTGGAPAEARQIGKEPAALPSTKCLTDITLQPTIWKMKYYYAGLACFAVGLGFFTIALAGGAVVWGFAYARLLHERDFRRSLRFQTKTVLPFVAIIAAYLLMRSHFNEVSRPFVDSMTQIVMDRPGATPARALSAVGELPVEFYGAAVERMMPYFQERYIIVLAFLGLMLVKEIAFRRKEAGVILMWLVFALLTIAFPTVGRLFFIFKSSGNLEDLLFPWYFYVPVAGISIALGLLLRPPPSVEEAVAGCSIVTRGLLFASVAVIIAALNFGNVREIRTVIPELREENQRFNGLLMEYKSSMTSFLHSPAYSSEREYYFKHNLLSGQSEFPLAWYVMQHDIFYLYFSDVKNIHFVNERQYRGDLYFWSPDGIIKKQWAGGLGL